MTYRKSPDQNSFTVKDLVALTLLLSVALMMRIPLLGTLYAEADELFQLFISSRSTVKELVSAIYSLGPQQYPLDYFIGFAVFRLTDSIPHLRTLPLCWSLFSIVSIYFLGRSIAGRVYGWLWAWLLVVSTLHIEYSQIFRPYSLIVFLSCLSLLLFYQLMVRRKGTGAYTTVAVLYQLIYPFAFVKNLLDITIGAFRRSYKKHKLILMLVPLLIPLIHWFWVGKNLVIEPVFQYSWAQVMGWETLKNFWMRFNQFDGVVLATYTSFFIVGVVQGVASRLARPFIIYGLSLMGLTFAAILISISGSHLFLHPRHAIVLLPLYLGGVAWGVMAVISYLEKKIGINSTAIAVVVALLSILAWGGASGSLHRYRSAKLQATENLNSHLSYIKQHAVSKEALVFSNPSYAATFIYYFDKPSFFKISGIVLSKGFDLFSFPTDLQLSQRMKVFVLSPGHEEVATIDREGLNILPEKRWLVHSTLNHVEEANPFEENQKVADGIYLIPPSK